MNPQAERPSQPRPTRAARTWALWLVLLALLAPHVVKAIDVLAGGNATLSVSQAAKIPVGPVIEVLLDETGALTLEEVRAAGRRFELRPANAGFGFHDGTLWVRLRLHNPSQEAWSRWLVSDLDRQENDFFYLVRERGSMDALTPDTKSGKHQTGRRTVFPVALGGGESATVYIACSGRASTVLNLSFWAPEAYLRHVETVAAARYFLMGTALLMAFASVIAARLRRAPGLLFGVAAVALAIAYMAIRDDFGTGFGAELLGLDQQQLMQITAILFVGSLAQFVRSFIAQDARSPRVQRILNSLSIASVPLALLPLWHSVPQIVVYFSGVAVAMITLFVVRHAIGGGGSARAYLLGWCLLMVGIMLRILQGIGWLAIDPDLLVLIAPAAFGLSSIAISGGLYRSILEVQERVRDANRELRVREAGERERLETAVAERTRELHAALALVEKASADKSGFLSMMAHEIRSPLHSVMGHVQLLQRKQETEQHRESIRAMESATTRLLKMVNQTLRFSRGEQEAIRLDPGPVVLGPYLEDIAASVEAASGEAAPRIKVSLGRGVPAVIEVDEQYLRQVLENLATNACKYAPEGIVQIVVETPPSGLVGTVGPLHRLRFSVIDRGPGIAMADHALIFEPFSRVSTQTRMHGVGLGLPICRQILQAMGSGLRLDSDGDRDRGACFWFELEVAALDEATEGAEEMVGSERESRPPDSLLAPAREMLELGQLLAIERWARATAETHHGFGPFLDKVVAHCIAVDLKALAKLFANGGLRRDPSAAQVPPPQ